MLLTGRHPSGEYIINGETPLASSLGDWISRRAFEPFENPSYRLDTHGRPRNKLYNISIANGEGQAVMKVSSIDPSYRPMRKIELLARSLLRDYNKTAFKNAHAMFAAGMLVAEPLAFWSHRNGLWDRRSYLLYRKIESAETVSEFCKRQLRLDEVQAPQKITMLHTKVVDALRAMHRCGFRYGDPHLNNVLVHADAESEWGICFVDYDKCSKAIIRWPWWKDFFDLRDIAAIGGDKDRDAPAMFLALYCQAPKAWQRAAVRFWSNGGFDFRRRISKKSLIRS